MTNPQKDEIERLVTRLTKLYAALGSVGKSYDADAVAEAIDAIAAMGRENEVLRAIEAEIADAEAVIERTDNHRVGAVQQGRIEAAEAIRAALTNTPGAKAEAPSDK